MPRISLTDATLRSLEPPQRGQVCFWDKGLKSFGVRISQAGSRTFVLSRDNTLITLGRYGVLSLSEARTEAKRLLAEFTLGRVRPQSISFDEAVKLYLADKQASIRPRTLKDYERQLSLFRFKGQLSQITQAEAERRVSMISAPSERQHALVAGRAFWRWCIKKKYALENPLTSIPIPKGKRRTRVLSDDELKRVWDASFSVSPILGSLVRLLITTGQRETELNLAQPEWIKDDCLHIPGDVAKNHNPHQLPLGPLSLSLFKQHPFKPYNSWSDGKQKMDELSGVKNWVWHDLRRTYRTNLARLGIPRDLSERMVNHISYRTEMERTYDIFHYLPQMRDAQCKLEAHLSQLLKIK